ncbi:MULTISPECIES: hypothetical protein [unclassified Streptomyces]|uniref:hypothetical protein n=1 Tax=unclassified Streptomyces TaxID=2593676 RepID=UPI00382C8DD9
MRSDLTPTPDRPGILIIAGSANSSPRAAYACRCGRTRTATGAAEVAVLVQDWETHRPQCSPTPARMPAPRRPNPTNRKRTTVPAAEDGGLFQMKETPA